MVYDGAFIAEAFPAHFACFKNNKKNNLRRWVREKG